MTSRAPTPLSPWEDITLRFITAAAEAGARAPTADDLQEACGCSSVSTTVNLVASLERRGLIAVDRYQRARRITIVATGKATAPVTNMTPHWRTRPRPAAMPSIGTTYIQDRKPDLVREMMVAARQDGMSLQDFMAELVWAGWQARAAAIQPSATPDQG